MRTRTLVPVLAALWLLSYWARDSRSWVAVQRQERSGISFDSRSPDKALSSYKVFTEAHGSEVNELEVSGRFLAHSSYYPNLFQTAPGEEGLRVEFYLPSVITIYAAAAAPLHTAQVRLADSFSLEQWHSFRIRVDREKRVRAYFDGRKTADRVVPELDFKVSELVVGTGLSRQRGFDGRIEDFRFSYTLWNRDHRAQAFWNLMLFCIGLALVVLLARAPESEPFWREAGTSFVIYGGLTAVAGISLAVYLGRLLGPALGGLSKWAPFLMAGLLCPVYAWLAIGRIRRAPGSRLDPAGRVILAVSASIATWSLLKLSLQSTHQFFPDLTRHQLPVVLMGSSVAAAAVLASRSPEKGLRPFTAAAAALLSIAAWCSLFQLTNWTALLGAAERSPAAFAALFVLCAAFTLDFTFETGTASRLAAWISTRLPTAAAWAGPGFLTAAGAAVLALSFRSDALFLGSSELHWEYYAGPIRALKNGAWLLWDAPSQYGFLNIACAAAIPASSSWQSLYLLQSLLLAGAAAMLFLTLKGKARTGPIVFTFLLTCSCLFFADPELIGPSPYPSSSVVRFFWCYVLLFYVGRALASGSRRPARFALEGGILWTLGCLWSAESAVYSTLTFVPGLLLAARREAEGSPGLPGQAARAAKVSAIPAAVFFASIGAIAAWYKLSAGHPPDWRCFFEYALGYTAGFGEVPLREFGAVWVLILLFAALSAAIAGLFLYEPEDRALAPAASALGCLWAVSSYFVGRAVPNNITAILPVLVMVTAAALRAPGSDGRGELLLPLKITIVPLLILSLMTPLAGGGSAGFPARYHGFIPDVAVKTRLAEASLQSLIDEAKLGPGDPIAYYGGMASMPRWMRNGAAVGSERNWLPAPLQLLEVPVTAERRERILGRFMARGVRPGFLIAAKSPPEQAFPERLEQWRRLIGKTYLPVRVLENADWSIVQYVPIPPRPAP